MHNCDMSFTVISFFALLFIFHFPAGAEQLLANIQQDDPCKNVDCGKGTCVPNIISILGFDCNCYPGWNKLQIGPLTFPSCVIPNCTVNFQCGNGAPPSSPPPASAPPPFNLSDPCNLVWCGDGTCVPSGSSHICQCFDGSTNIFNMTDMACFKQCYFGADCYQLGLGRPPTPLPPTPTNGSNDASKCLRSYHSFLVVLLCAFILASI